MSREKAEKVNVSFRLTEEESEKLKQCAAAETCKEIEDFILELQQTFTAPQRFDVAKLIEKGAV